MLRSLDKLQQVQYEIAQEGGVALAVAADITDPAAVAKMQETALQAFPGGVDLLVNNAAYVPPIHR